MVRHGIRGLLPCVLVLVPLIVLSTVILQKYSSSFKVLPDEWSRTFSDDLDVEAFEDSDSKAEQVPKEKVKDTEGVCFMKQVCPEDHFSFYMKSGAANVVGPKICVQNKVIVGTMLNNVGHGLNIVIINGETGETVNTAVFNMYGGEVEPLIALLKDIKDGSVVLIATWDDPATKLNEEARNLITELGSANVKSLGFRDNWVFVGGKGATVKSNFEKHLRNDHEMNKYDNWPELIELQGCIPKYIK